MTGRKDIRFRKNLLVNISFNGYDGLGLVLNVSRHGLYVESLQICPPNTNLSLLMAVGNDLIPLRGRVVWSCLPARNDLSQKKGGMGIRIGNVPRKYTRLLNGFADMN